MSKELVDRELLEQCVELLDLLPESRTVVSMRELLAQPAEAEGVELVPFWVLFDATTPEPLIKKHMPEGWKLVPIKPTKEMLAVCKVAGKTKVWDDMLAAAPTAPIAQTAPQPEQSGLVEALEYYADGDHLLLADPDAWDTCSGEPDNFLHDEAGTASVEDGSIARVALEAYRAALSAQGGE